MANKKSLIDEFMALPDAEREAELAQYDREIPQSELHPLNAADRKLLAKAQRRAKRGRPKLGAAGVKTVAITLEKDFLKQVDKYARAHKVKRSALIVRGLEMAMKAG